MKKAPSDSPIWQLKKMELLLPLSYLITKPIQLDLSNLHYRPVYKPHYRTQGCMIRENDITAPIRNPIYYKKSDKITYSHAMLKVRENIIIFITQNDDEHLYKAHIRFKTQ